MDVSDVKEGFICPVCMKNLHGVAELQAHFNNSHQEDKLIKQSLRDFIGKAKQRIKREVSDYQPAAQGTYKYRPLERVRQDIGVTTSHMTLFKRVRDERVDHLSRETNKLIIRLDKLLTKLPADPVKRKAHERSVVAWVEDDAINLCPDCGRSFGLTRRKHHCRLCGFVMCARCSTFLCASRGQKLALPSPAAGWVPPTVGAAPADPDPSSSLWSKKRPLGLLRRSGSVGSLNSMVSLVDAVTGEQQLRICRHCDQKLSHREYQLDQQSSEPIIVQFYNQMRGYQKEIRELIPMHNKMLESLLAGETRYHLSDANSIRVKILTTAERVDGMSKRINALGTENDDLSPWERQLRARLRSAASAFLKEEVISLPQLPNEKQLKELQAKLKEEQERQLAEEQERLRAAAAAEEAASRRPRPASSVRRVSPVSAAGRVQFDAGWSPPAVAAPSAADPLLQQMEIVRGYIRQARSSHKYDELALFEQNLADLHAEFERLRAADAARE
ncbi:rabenosyn-5-like [Amphibalanus amphitrite]|uniref:rabenosyn-5-like n=1 Tax=Amphibalanus amphitrite TaxID=1232801 RepID=UPI001C913877|nr:rabenosyn-5-like [Amphibalanus amphitrite]XP_043233677.1 rabenosyn-5-like [Amphibalanus amphitrite]XP_043233687.1 rabenosyn-5-like [Amphibalanus amphitrite]